MRTRDFLATALCLAAVPAFAQQSTRDVTGPWTLNSTIVTCTDLPIVTKPVPRLVIKAPQTTDDRLALATGQQIVIGRSPDDGLAIGQRYTASRLNNEQSFPRPGEGFGGLRVTGFLTVTAINEWNALADIDLACDVVQPGDYLEPFVESELPTTAAPNLYPDFSDRGSILFSSDNRTLVGDGDVVSIDRGTAHGVTVGARFAVYRDKRNPNGSPLIYLGDVVVMSTNELTSKVIVTKAKDGILSGDTVVPRRLTEPKQ